MDSGGEGVVAMVEHALGVVAALSGGLDAQVSEHGVRFPSAEELDVVRVDVGAEEGSGPTRSERASAEKVGLDASGGLKGSGGVPQGVGDEGRFGVVPTPVERVGVVVTVNGCVVRSVVDAKVPGNACEGFDRADKRVVGSAVADEFAPDSVLLVSESQVRVCDAVDAVQIIQRR